MVVLLRLLVILRLLLVGTGNSRQIGVNELMALQTVGVVVLTDTPTYMDTRASAAVAVTPAGLD